MSEPIREVRKTEPASFPSFGGHPKVLWIVSSGGHLAQAHRIEGLIGRNPDSLWITFDSPQSRSLLESRRVEFVDYVAPRDLRGALRVASRARKLARAEGFDLVASTGAAIAGVALPRLALTGARTMYVESISRSTGPSVTGRIMAVAPRVSTFTQYPSWANRRWRYEGSVLDDFEARAHPVTSGPRRIFVTLGTIRPYRFDRAVDALLAVIRPDDTVTWQVGVTDRDDLPGETVGEIPAEEMLRHIDNADVVVTHSGVGSILNCLERGKVPVLMVRTAAHNEHVDDHQQNIADIMTARGLAYELDLSAPDRDPLDRAAARRAEVRPHPLDHSDPPGE